jgi:hypothetical protein
MMRRAAARDQLGVQRTRQREGTMLKLIEGLPPAVVGVEALGEVTAGDYEHVLVPAVAAAREASGGKVRILYVFGEEFPGLTAGAMWQDTKLGLGHLGSWERIALVTDADWLRRSISALAWAIPGEVRVFGSAHANDARSWVAE